MARRPRKDRQDDLKPPEMSEDDKIIQEAKDNFKVCNDWEAGFQTLYKDDVKFANGDSDNGWQWPRDLKKEREKNKRPALTINKTAGLVALIVNDAKQNKPSVSIKPVGEETSFKAAQIYEGLVRHIEYVSKAQAIYDEATQSQVEGGIGWWRVTTDYVDNDTFDQDIRIQPVKNQLGVYIDPNIQQKDGSDAMFGFVFEDEPRKDIEREYPDLNFGVSSVALSGPDTWIQPDYIRKAEYYRIKLTDDELIYMEDEQGNEATFYRSDVPPAFKKQIVQADKDGLPFKKRKVKKRSLEWFKIVGDTIVERRELKGRYIPLVRVVGIERVIDGKLYRRGHVRFIKDPQRMYNYNTSAQVEYGATGTKSPWVGPKKAFEGNETAWNNANVQNAAYLTYNSVDEDGNPVPKPERLDPPGLAPAFIDGMKIAEHEMDMASGQYQAQQGQPSNEKSGRAIAERQRQGDTATYHFIDNLAIAIRYTGMLILDLIPHYYDTERIIQTLGKDGTQSKVYINPNQDEAIKEIQEDREVIKIMFNPKVGKYLVESDIGPAYSTQRQEAWNAFVQIVTGAPNLIDEIGDLMFRSADFPLADKIAERLMRKIKTEKPYLFDEAAPTPAMQQLQTQVNELSQEVSDLLQRLAEYRLKLTGKEQMRDIDAFDAETKRITAVSNAQLDVSRLNDPQLLGMFKQVVMDTLQEMKNVDVTQDVKRLGDEQNGQPIQVPQQPSAPMNAPVGALDFHPERIGAKRAPDGNYYVPHKHKKGSYLRVDYNG